jgi:hypothetical protein
MRDKERERENSPSYWLHHLAYPGGRKRGPSEEDEKKMGGFMVLDYV